MILLDLEPIKSDISISALSEEIGISRTTIYKYKDLAEYILDFERDYPSFDGEPITNGSGLTEYQSWVIQALISYRRKRGLTMDALKAYIKSAKNQVWVTKQSYREYQEKFANGHEAIRQQ